MGEEPIELFWREDRRLPGTTFGSSVSAAGSTGSRRSLTARRKMLCSRAWYLRTDLGDSPPAMAAVTQAWTVVGRTADRGMSPK